MIAEIDATASAPGKEPARGSPPPSGQRTRTHPDHHGRFRRGEIPPGGKCDVKTLARESGIDRTAFYGDRPYARLRQEFEARLAAAVSDGDTPDPREAQISRLKAQASTLTERLARWTP